MGRKVGWGSLVASAPGKGGNTVADAALLSRGASHHLLFLRSLLLSGGAIAAKLSYTNDTNFAPPGRFN